MRALSRATVIITEYQHDSSSKRPRSFVVSAARSTLMTASTVATRAGSLTGGHSIPGCTWPPAGPPAGDAPTSAGGVTEGVGTALNRRKPPGLHRRPPREASCLESSHTVVLLLNALADNRVAPEDLEPYPLPGRVYRNARGAAEHPQQEVAPTAAGNAERAIANRLDRDVPLRARNAAHRNALRGLNRLREREARADRLVQTLENEHRAAAVAEEPELLGLCATLDREIARIPPVLLPSSGNCGDCRNDTKHRYIDAIVTLTGRSPCRGAGVS